MPGLLDSIATLQTGPGTGPADRRAPALWWRRTKFVLGVHRTSPQRLRPPLSTEALELGEGASRTGRGGPRPAVPDRHRSIPAAHERRRGSARAADRGA